jgi:dipeptidyl aminopeptidase/acylaminoacyl peptidase
MLPKIPGITALILLLVIHCSALGQTGRKPLSIDDLLKLKTVGDPQISPDGQWIAFTVTEADLEKDETETRIWMIAESGGEMIPMTAKGYSASQPRWSPDNKYLSFLAKKKSDEKTQVWTLDRRGGEAQQLTCIPQGVSGHEWSPDGKRLVLSIRDARPEELTKDKEDDKKAKPHIIV